MKFVKTQLSRTFGWRYFAKKALGHLHANELLYATMFNEAIRLEGIKTPFFPTRGAANYSLLYMLVRIATEQNISRAMELGGGQSTLLLDALGVGGITLESNELWTKHLAFKTVNREVVYAPLRSQKIHGRDTETYNISFGLDKVDLFLIDGPTGKNRFSRWGALDVLDKCLGEEFIVIFDDINRKGERDTALEFLKHRNERVRVVTGLSSQLIVFTKKFDAIAWY